MFRLPLARGATVGALVAAALASGLALTPAGNAAPVAPQTAPYCYYTVGVDVLNVRSGPGTEFQVVDQVYRGEPVQTSRLDLVNGYRTLWEQDERWIWREGLIPDDPVNFPDC